MKLQEDGNNSAVNSFIIYTLHQVVLVKLFSVQAMMGLSED
jgi:hypothetical protein